MSDKNPGCLLCEKPGESADRSNLILRRDKLTYVMMNKYPYTNGHVMVSPYRHVPCLDELKPEEAHELIESVSECTARLKKAISPEGFNVGLNIGSVAGAGVREHIHFHIVPRWHGDTNFMPVVSDVKVMPEHLLSTYDKLLGFFTDGEKR